MHLHCGKCVEACPADAIFPLGADWGAAAGTPAIDARKQPCVLCTGLKCTHVCPSGALLPTHANSDVMMGKARLDPDRCLTHHGQACTVCREHCPRPGALVFDDARQAARRRGALRRLRAVRALLPDGADLDPRAAEGLSVRAEQQGDRARRGEAGEPFGGAAAERVRP